MRRTIVPFKLLSALTVTCIALAQLSNASASGLANLRVDSRDNPIGIDNPSPRFSWQTAADANNRGVEQTAYRLVVRSSAGVVVWDTGRLGDSRSIEIPYAGAKLEPETRYTWTVTTWDNHRTENSAEGWFETGIQNSDPALSGWNGAKWIGGAPEDAGSH